MAIGTTLPPRAYTREILTAAFNWLQTQPESVRTKATTPDVLVGLYTRAQRFGSMAESEAPVSSQNFMSDLKNLAEGLKAFDGAKVQLSPTEAGAAAPMSVPLAAPLATPQTSPRMDLNERALAMLQEIRSVLNLSSESEAANMMIALAYKSLKTTLLA